jgi:cytochrome c peroxidase
MRAIAVVALGVCVGAAVLSANSTRRLPVPLGLDLYVPAPSENPITPEKLALGRRLFFDRRLSGDRRTSCATCHQPSRAFTDGRVVSVGVHGRRGRRNTPSLLNRAYGQRFFWDGRTTTLEGQVTMALQGRTDLDLPAADAATRLSTVREYVTAFRAAFDEPVSARGIVRALATFVRGQLSANSAYDRFAAGDRRALSSAAQRGLDLFTGKANCWQCHAGSLFTDEGTHNTGVGPGRDAGRFEFTRHPDDRGRFKTPSLRNVAVTAPYMHDGSLASLDAVVGFYDRGGGPNPHLDRLIRPLRLSSDERRSLVAFLDSLTGRPSR